MASTPRSAGAVRQPERAHVTGIGLPTSQTRAGRLIQAHDTERMCVAARLHDEVSQRLAGLSIAISSLKRRSDINRDTRAELTQLQQMTIDIVETIRQVSNELHPTTLQHVGLSMALSALCRDYAGRMKCAVTLDSTEARDIPPEAALCLYRATEEALRNIQSHARASRVTIELARTAESLTVTILDDGHGFDTSEPRARGLGLMIVEERAQSLGGCLRVETRPGRGTRVSVTLPADATPPAA